MFNYFRGSGIRHIGFAEGVAEENLRFWVSRLSLRKLEVPHKISRCLNLVISMI